MPLADEQEEGDETDVSLITGALRSHNLLSSEPAQSPYGSSVVLRNQTLTVANTNPAGMGQSESSDTAFKTLFAFISIQPQVYCRIFSHVQQRLHFVALCIMYKYTKVDI